MAPLTLQVASDLHFEEHRDGGQSFIESMDPTGVDVLALVGDIIAGRFARMVTDVFIPLAKKFKHILFVPGNHELWRTEPIETLTMFARALAPLTNVTLMNNQVLSIQGHRFIGGPMWFPQWSPLSEVATLDFADFSQIVNFREWVLKENTKFQAFLERNLQMGDVVLTHHMPSYQSVPPRYAGDPTNAFFVCNQESIIHERKPRLWVHGHGHTSMDYMLDRTRVVCNPFGYPAILNPNYVEKMLLHLD